MWVVLGCSMASFNLFCIFPERAGCSGLRSEGHKMG
jgi:hypothetical protein